MDPRIYQPGIYTGPTLYNGDGTVYNGRGVYKYGSVSKGFILDVDKFDVNTFKQDDIQFYGYNVTKSGDKLLLNRGVLTYPLGTTTNYDLEIELDVLSFGSYIYPCGRTFLQGGTWFTPWGSCIIQPYENLIREPNLNSLRTTWSSWGYTTECWITTNPNATHIKFKEICRDRHYKQIVNNVVVLDFDTLMDYPNLTGDANYNISTANGLNKCGIFIEYGIVELSKMNLYVYD